jgi:hypothetical protein
MVSSGLLRRVALVRTDISKEAPGSYETSVLTRATRHNNPEHTILHSHRRENLKSYTVLVLTYSTTSIQCVGYMQFLPAKFALNSRNSLECTMLYLRILRFSFNIKFLIIQFSSFTF